MIDSNWRYEERWTYNCLMFHMFRLRQIYNDYAKLFAKSAPKCNLAMSRLCLWQLWRDCGIHEKGFSLVEIDSYIGKHPLILIIVSIIHNIQRKKRALSNIFKEIRINLN